MKNEPVMGIESVWERLQEIIDRPAQFPAGDIHPDVWRTIVDLGALAVIVRQLIEKDLP